MSGAYTVRNLADVDDAAPKFGLGDSWEARMARSALGAEQTGVGFFRLRPGRRSPFAHRHDQAEEVYVILRGRGRMRLDDEVVEVGPLDAVRVGPRRWYAPSRRGRTAWTFSSSGRTTLATANWSTTAGPAAPGASSSRHRATP